MKAKISVSGGKGGTGKSTVAVNLALSLARKRIVTLADLDAEAPNDHVLLGVEYTHPIPVKIMVPKIIYSECIKCRACANVCDTGAIIMGKDNLPFLLPRLCSGCRACYYACPTNAIIEEKRIVGYTYITKVDKYGSSLTLVSSVLREGEEHTPPVVIHTREKAYEITEDLLIVDTAAGTASHVASAIEDSDVLLAVTEPTPLGKHDLELILRLGDAMNIEKWIVLNRSNIASPHGIEELSRKYNAKIIARIPYSHEILDSYVSRIPIVYLHPKSPVSSSFEKLAENLLEVI